MNDTRLLLQNRVVLITGASRGIGAATARLLAAHGAAVAINYHRSHAAARSVLEQIEQAGGRGFLAQADVRDPDEVEQLVRQVEGALGPIDTLVLNANIDFPVVSFLEYPWEAFQAKIVGEMAAAFHLCQAIAPGMHRRHEGCIIAVSSGLSRHPGQGFCAHSAAKSALDALVRSLALELGPSGIRVNTVAPGLTLTDATAGVPKEVKSATAAHTPLRRVALPEDVAGAILLVASQHSGFLTGTYVPVSGGELMP